MNVYKHHLLFWVWIWYLWEKL